MISFSLSAELLKVPSDTSLVPATAVVVEPLADAVEWLVVDASELIPTIEYLKLMRRWVPYYQVNIKTMSLPSLLA